jgi:hypothetical protein
VTIPFPELGTSPSMNLHPTVVRSTSISRQWSLSDDGPAKEGRRRPAFSFCAKSPSRCKNNITSDIKLNFATDKTFKRYVSIEKGLT